MYGQPIVIKQQAPRRQSYKRRRPSRVYKKYKRAYYNVRRYRRYLQEQVGPRGSDKSKAYWGEDWAHATPAQQALRRGVGFRGKGDYNFGLFNFTRGSSMQNTAHLAGIGGYGFDAEGASVPQGNQIIAGSAQTPITVNGTDDLSGDIIISQKEFLQNVNVTTTGAGVGSAFSVVNFPINPGLQLTFPWLSQLAQNFTLYEFIGLIFEYKPTSGEFGGTTSNALGKVIMATQYDPDAPAFVTSVEMENYQYATATKPSLHCLHGVETDPRQRATKMLYVRSGDSPKDQIFTDIGDFQIATEGIVAGAAATFPIGEIWVTYRIKLSRAKLNNSILLSNQLQDQFVGLGTTGAGTTLFDNNAGLSATILARYQPPTSVPASRALPRLTNNLGGFCSSTAETNVTYTFPTNISQGLYRVVLWANAGAAITSIPSATLVVLNCVQVAAPGVVTAAGGTANQAQATSTTSGSLMLEAYVQVTAPGNLQASFAITLSAALTTVATVALSVCQMNSVLAT